jgi:hypothetical protein
MEATEIKLNVPLLVSVTALEEEIPTASAVTFVFASVARTPCLTGEVPTTSFALILSDPMASSGLGHQSRNPVTGEAHSCL